MVALRKNKKKDLDVPLPPSKRKEPDLPKVSGMDAPPTPGLDMDFPPLPRPKAELKRDMDVPKPRAGLNMYAPPRPHRNVVDDLDDMDDLDMDEMDEEEEKHTVMPVHAIPAQDLSKIGTHAPIFIKIERYKDVVKDIQRLKMRALNLRDALDALTDMEKELRKGLELTIKVLDGMNSITATLDSKFLRFQGVTTDQKIKIAEGTEEIDHYVKNLHYQMERIKHELRTVSV